jgi:6-phosphogluconolactonase
MKYRKSKSQGRQLSTIVIFASLLGLAGCLGNSNIQTLPPGCGNNCPPSPEFLYATSTDHILAFTIDQSTGALGTPLAMTGPNQGAGMAATVTLGHLYVSDFLNDAVDGFSINSSSGGLTAITGSPFPLGGTPPGAGGLAMIVPGSVYLYATDLNAGAVAAFTFDSLSGKLTPVPGSPFSAGNTPMQAVQAGFQGKFLYVSNLNDSAGGISAFNIDFNTGALSAVVGSPFPTGPDGSFPGPSALVVGGNNSNILYVALAGTAKIAAFAIDPTTGGLTALPGSPFTTGSDPLYITLVPITIVGSQEFLYTANVQDHTISAFTADGSTGILTTVSGSPYAAGTSVGGLTTSLTATSTGSYFLYAADPQAKSVRAYTVDGNTGALSPLPGSPFPAGNAPMLLTVARGP